jgi:phage terminase small subunit
MALNTKQQLFVEHYLQHWNATQAAIRAGYSDKTAYSIGQRLLKDVEVAEAIAERIAQVAMSADEVLIRLADQARSDMGDFMTDYGELDLAKAKTSGKLHLIKSYTSTDKGGVKVELYDAQAALVHLGRHHGLFVDRQELTGKNGEPLQPVVVREVVVNLTTPKDD